MRYHQVNDRGELMTGVCRSTPEVLPDGRIRLHETPFAAAAAPAKREIVVCARPGSIAAAPAAIATTVARALGLGRGVVHPGATAGALAGGVRLALGLLARLLFLLAFLFQLALAFFKAVVGGCQCGVLLQVQATVAGAGAAGGSCQRTAPR